MTSRLVIAALALALIAGALALVLRSPRPRSEAAPSATLDRGDAAAGPEAKLESPPDQSPILAVAHAEPPPESATPAAAVAPLAPAPPATLAFVNGRLLDPDGSPIRGDGRFVWFTDADGSTRGANWTAEGERYRSDGLAPGHWWCQAGAPGHRRTEREVDLLLGEQELDFVLEPKVVLQVRALTPDGRAFRTAAKEAKISWSPLVAIATLEAPPAPLPFEATEGRALGVGRFQGYRGSLDEFLGTLELDVDPPVFASLTLGTAVLGTQPVPPGAGEVVFVLGVEEVDAALATVRFRVRDSAGSPASGTMFYQRTEADGGLGSLHGDEVVLRWVPGDYLLRLLVEGHETYERDVSAGPGEDLDLGTIQLQRRIEIRGRLVAGGGQGLEDAVVFWGKFSEDGSVTVEDNFAFSAHEDGTFELPLSRGRYLLRARAEGLTARAVVVDATQGDVEGLEIELVPPSSLVLENGGASWEGSAYRLFDEGGFVAAGGRLSGSAPISIPVPPGRYRLQVYDSDGALRDEGFVTVSTELTRYVIR